MRSRLAVLLIVALSAAAARADTVLERSQFSSGAAHLQAASTEHGALLGDVMAGHAATGSFELFSGFWGRSFAALVGVDRGIAPAPPFGLAPCRPNPASRLAIIDFQLPRKARASLAIYDVRGRLVQQLASGVFPPGRHEAAWDLTTRSGALAAPGIYWYRFSSGAFEATRKLVVVR